MTRFHAVPRRIEPLRCPKCGSPVPFDGKIGYYKCDHCGWETEP